MATRTRKLEVEISGEDRGAGKTFKKVGEGAEDLEPKLRKEGEKAGKGFQRGVDKGVDSNGFAAKMKGLGEKVSGAFKAALAAGAVAAAGAFAVGFMGAVEKELALDKLEAQLGGGEFAADMGKIAGDLYLDAFGESIGEVGDVLKRVWQGGILAEDATNAQIKNITAGFLTFADVLDQDVNMAIQAVGRMMKSGLVPDAEAALDVLTRGIQQGADSAEDLLETFQEYSTMFRDVGISAEDATGLMVQGLRAGARDADKVADAIKEFAIRAQDGSDATREAFKNLGMDADEMMAKVAAGGPTAREAFGQVLDGLREIEDPMLRNLTATGLFRTQAEDLGDALFALDLDTAAQGLGDTAGATDKLASAYDNAATRIEEFKRRALDKLVTFIGEEVIPRLESFAEWVGENEDKVKIFGAVLLGFVGTALAAYVVSMISAAVATIAATWPILAIIAAVGALAFGLWYAWQNWEWFRKGVLGAWAMTIQFVGWVQSLVGWVWNLVSAVWAAVGAIRQLVSSAGGIGGIAKKIFGGFSALPGMGLLPGLGGIIGGFLADGGPAMAGVPYVVGEDGPELFVPSRSGTVIPNDVTTNMIAAEGRGGNRYVGTAVLELDGRRLGEAMIDFSADYRATNGRDPFGR